MFSQRICRTFRSEILPIMTYSPHWLPWQHRLLAVTSNEEKEPSNPKQLVQSTNVTMDMRSTPFDTYTMMNELQKIGFSEPQSRGLVTILMKLSDSEYNKSRISSHDLDLLEMKILKEIDNVRHNQTLLEKSSISQLKDSSEELKAEIGRLKELLKDEVKKVQSGVQLDINLERSRNQEQGTLLEQKIKDTHNRISNEIALLKIAMESNKLDLLKYLSGGIITIVTIMVSVVMGIWRLSK